MMNKYYVYIHVKDGKVIYCGKGIKRIYHYGTVYDRAYSNKGRKYDVKDVEVFKVKYFDNEQDAYAYEEKLTDYFKSIGQCEYNIDIANKRGEETREKMSENHADFSGEKHPMYGKLHSEETRKKISENHADMSGENNGMYGRTGAEHPRSKVVIAFTDTGSYYQEFTGTKDAERELSKIGVKVHQQNICKCCKGKQKSAGKITVNGKKEKLIWKYKES